MNPFDQFLTPEYVWDQTSSDLSADMIEDDEMLKEAINNCVAAPNQAELTRYEAILDTILNVVDESANDRLRTLEGDTSLGGRRATQRSDMITSTRDTLTWMKSVRSARNQHELIKAYRLRWPDMPGPNVYDAVNAGFDQSIDQSIDAMIASTHQMSLQDQVSVSRSLMHNALQYAQAEYDPTNSAARYADQQVNRLAEHFCSQAGTSASDDDVGLFRAMTDDVQMTRIAIRKTERGDPAANTEQCLSDVSEYLQGRSPSPLTQREAVKRRQRAGEKKQRNRVPRGYGDKERSSSASSSRSSKSHGKS